MPSCGRDVLPEHRTDHFDGRRFFNPSGAQGQPVWMVPRMLLTPRTRWPSRIPVEPRRLPDIGLDAVVVTFVGHATFLISAAAGGADREPPAAPIGGHPSGGGNRLVAAREWSAAPGHADARSALLRAQRARPQPGAVGRVPDRGRWAPDPVRRGLGLRPPFSGNRRP